MASLVLVGAHALLYSLAAAFQVLRFPVFFPPREWVRVLLVVVARTLSRGRALSPCATLVALSPWRASYLRIFLM